MYLDWLLYIIVFTNLPGFTPTQKIGEYSSQEACEKALEYVQANMRESYKGDSSFQFKCVFQPKKVRA